MNTARLLAVVAVVVLVGGLSPADARHRKRCCTPLARFRSHVQSAIAENTITIRPAEVTISPANAGRPPNLHYYLGGRIEMFQPARIPLDEPLSLQCTIEAIRMHCRSDFWSGPIEQAEACTDAALALIESHSGDRDELFKQLQQVCSAGQQCLSNAVRNYARANGMTVTTSAPAPAPVTYPVRIETLPQGARVYQLSVWEYDTLSAEKRNDYKQWRELGSTATGPLTIQVVGSMYFWIKWPRSGRQYSSGQYTISGPTSITFVP